MPPKRSAGAKASGFKAQSKARSAQSKASLKKNKKNQHRRPRDKAATADGEKEDASDVESVISDYADSDEVSQISSDDDGVEEDEVADDGDVDRSNRGGQHGVRQHSSTIVKALKTVAAASFAFLTDLEKDKLKPPTKKEETKLHAKRNKSDKLELAEAKKRLKAEQHLAKIKAQQEDEEEEEDFSDISGMSDLEDEEDDLDEGSVGSEHWEEHSDVSEGEAVQQSDDQQPEQPSKLKGKKRKADDEADGDDEARVMERLRKRTAREELEAARKMEQNRNKRLPIRTADGQIVEADESSEDEETGELPDDSDDDDDGMQGLSDDDDDDGDEAQSSRKDSRAVHAPLREDSPSSSQAAEEAEARARANATPHSSMLHSTRFNLTAPYEICLLGFVPPSSAAAASSSAAAMGKGKAKAKADANAAMAKRMQMVQLARNQIASLASQIVADPEVSLNLLRRLAVFAERTIQPPPEQLAQVKMEQAQYKKLVAMNGGLPPSDVPPPRPLRLQIDPAIRQLSLLSILAVLLDILPGYRIRSLTEKEQEEQVGQEVARRREYEQGLVSTYRDFLELCEQEVKDRESLLHASALRCLTTLATRATHFNYRDNVLQCIVARMSRRRWGKDEESCYEALVEVVREDRQGAVSYEVVRLIHRMTKERRFKVNSRVLDILLELRLKDELGTKRASTDTASDPVKEAEKERQERERKRIQNKVGKGKATPKEVRKGLGQHLSKKQSKKMKELKTIEAEMKEAEATVDLQERERHQTETLKLLFVLYFTILKAPIGTIPLHLLGSALEGLSRFAHRVNVDFFRDLLAVLRVHVTEARKRVASDVDRFAGLDRLSTHHQQGDDDSSDEDDAPSDADDGDDDDQRERRVQNSDLVHRSIRHALLCLNTAFELLSGQGDVLNLDLSDMTTHLYALMLPLSTLPDLEQDPDSNNPYSFGAKAEVETKRTVYGQEKRSIKHNTRKTLADLLFRSLDLVILFPPPRSIPIDRTASFIKRLCIVALQFPSASVQRSLKLVAKLMAREDRLLALVETTDRAKDGVYDAVAANPDATAGGVLKCGEVLWELEILKRAGNLEVQELVDRIRRLGVQK